MVYSTLSSYCNISKTKNGMYSCAIRGKENIEWVEVSEEETIDLDELEDMFPDGTPLRQGAADSVHLAHRPAGGGGAGTVLHSAEYRPPFWAFYRKRLAAGLQCVPDPRPSADLGALAGRPVCVSGGQAADSAGNGWK